MFGDEIGQHVGDAPVQHVKNKRTVAPVHYPADNQQLVRAGEQFSHMLIIVFNHADAGCPGPAAEAAGAAADRAII
ncbi:hypothetical protein D3C75_1334540 [compost metagenome]